MAQITILYSPVSPKVVDMLLPTVLGGGHSNSWGVWARFDTGVGHLERHIEHSDTVSDASWGAVRQPVAHSLVNYQYIRLKIGTSLYIFYQYRRCVVIGD